MQTVTVSTKGQLVIPADIRTELGIDSGTRVTLSVEAGRIILQPVSPALVDRLQGILSSKPGLAEDLQKERRNEKW